MTARLAVVLSSMGMWIKIGIWFALCVLVGGGAAKGLFNVLLRRIHFHSRRLSICVIFRGISHCKFVLREKCAVGFFDVIVVN